MNARSYILTFILLYISVAASAQKTALKNAFGVPFEVTDVVDHSERLTSEKFWSFFQPSRTLGKPVDPWTNPVLRDYFFGRYWAHEGAADPIKDSDKLLALPHTKGMLGKEVEASQPLIIADDIPFHPIMRRWHNYSSRYYPRRMQDWIVGSFQPAYLLTGKKAYKDRLREMLSFLLYSQYQTDGHNQFVKDFFPEHNTALLSNGNAVRWRGGWDYLFDWEWRDSYGYQWQLHEPDHHVGANMALAMIQGWQLLGDEKYLKSAEAFFEHQVPDYGFHSGIWNGHKYYWTQYGRSGFPENATSATDNIQALVARTAAMLGFYKKDPVLLEYARGLLWYQVREFKTDGRWYYDGAENPLNKRRSPSHEGLVLNDGLTALAYLMKAGMPVDEFIEPLGSALNWYRENFDMFMPEKDYQAWKMFTRKNTIIYVQATTSPLDKLSIERLTMKPKAITRLAFTADRWKEEPFDLSETLKRGEIIKIVYPGLDTEPAKISAEIPGIGRKSKELRILPPGLQVNAETFLSFPEKVHFPGIN
jgi:hypothetical protein